jgi:hypothetical protein
VNNLELREQFIRAVNCFKNRPAMLRQALRDAEMYQKEGQLTNIDVTMLKRLALGYGSCGF